MSNMEGWVQSCRLKQWAVAAAATTLVRPVVKLTEVKDG